MSDSEGSAVTYTSVYTDSELGRVFWGTDEEVSEGGVPRVIVYGYDGFPIQPVPQDEDEREPRFVEVHDTDFVPEHVFPAEEQPLPPVDSPTAESATPTRLGRMTKPYSSTSFIANCFITGSSKDGDGDTSFSKKSDEHAGLKGHNITWSKILLQDFKRFTVADDLKETSKITQVKGTMLKDHYLSYNDCT
ncbi:hypothetical protein Tco_0859006 [Tanacetum coccineum]|uniref:Uncharacterized protein n=1 Tax=Tanacetum coccineum TaxID=301880 RepID=A0ABQ5BGF1_9ASTR